MGRSGCVYAYAYPFPFLFGEYYSWRRGPASSRGESEASWASNVTIMKF